MTPFDSCEQLLSQPVGVAGREDTAKILYMPVSGQEVSTRHRFIIEEIWHHLKSADALAGIVSRGRYAPSTLMGAKLLQDTQPTDGSLLKTFQIVFLVGRMDSIVD